MVARHQQARRHETLKEQREIQRKTERRERAAKAQTGKQGKAASSGSSAGPRTSTRRQPRPPMPEQHQRKPGKESELDPRPRFLAPDYRGSGKLEGMAAVITGGDSGIGRAVAILFAREGADVAIVYLSEDDDAMETCHYVEREGTHCVAIAGDVRDAKFCESAVKQAVGQFGRLDILVNNAGFQEHAGSLEDLTDEHIEQTLGTNVHGYINMTRAALKHLHEGSAIINTGSETGLFGHGGLLDYSATKGAIHALTKSLASNLLERGIRVNAVAPGPVWTPFNPADKGADAVSRFGQGSAMQRPAQPEELSPLYVFLAAPVCSSYINGAIVPVLGGPTG